ncbi:MAG: helix-turn-helix transcriptional regulator [Selenomonadales bacterium]|nr:helix-turn-helix transcriptional regulator [Selenomonadales bacterium]
MIEFRGETYQCSMEFVIRLIGGKWKALILNHLQYGVLRFSEIKKCLPRITQKMLTQQLRELESFGLVYRHVYRQVPPKVEYELTEQGRSLIPILSQMCAWGREYAEKENKKFESES